MPEDKVLKEGVAYANATIEDLANDPPKEGEPLDRVLADLSSVDQYTARTMQEVHAMCSAQMSEVHQNAVQFRHQYEGGDQAPRDTYYSGTARTYPNITYKHCDTAAAKAMAMMFPSLDFFEVEPDDRDSRSAELIAKQVTRHYVHAGDIIPKMEPGIDNVCIDGTVIIQGMWSYKTAPKRVRSEKEEEKKTRMKRTPVSPSQRDQEFKLQVIEDAPDIEIIDLKDFFVPDITVENISDVDFCGKRFWTTLRALKADKQKMITVGSGEGAETIYSGKYKNIDLITQTESPINSSQNDKDESVDGVQAMPDSYMSLSRRVQVVEYYFSSTEDFFEAYKANDGASDDSWRDYLKEEWDFSEVELHGGLIVTFANDQVPIMYAPMNDLSGDLGKMFVIGNWMRRAGSMFGIGIPELMREYQLEACAMDNQAIDNMSLQIAKQFFYDDSVGIDPDDLANVSPGKGIPVSQMLPGADISNLLHENIPAPLPNDFWSWRVSLRREVEEITGITDIMMGGASSTDATATEVSARTTASETRFLRRIKNLERNVVAKLLRNIWDMIDDLVDDDLSISIMSKNGERLMSVVKRSQIFGSFTFRPVGAREMQDRFIKSQQMLILLNNPELAQYIDVPVVLTAWYENLGFHDPGRFVKDPMKRKSMLDIEAQWRSFMLGVPVEVTGEETMEEHDEAIRANGETFLRDMLPKLVEVGSVSEEEAEHITNIVTQNVESHNKWIEHKQQQQQEQIQALAIEQMMKAGGNQQAAGPMNEAQVLAGSGQFPGPLPSSVGA